MEIKIINLITINKRSATLPLRGTDVKNHSYEYLEEKAKELRQMVVVAEVTGQGSVSLGN